MQRFRTMICICKEDGTEEKREGVILKLCSMEIVVYNVESAVLAADHYPFIKLLSIDKKYDEGMNAYTEIKIKLRDSIVIVEPEGRKDLENRTLLY